MLSPSLKIIALMACLAIPATLISAQENPFIPTETNSWPVDNVTDLDAESPIDLRALNEAEAGEHGFIRVDESGRGFVRGDGEPIRFWAVHASEERKNWSNDDLRAYCRFLARMGVNLALAGTMMQPAPDQDNLSKVDPATLDLPWRRVARLKEQGIYSEIRAVWFHSGFKQDPGIEGYGPGDSLYGVIFFSQKLQEIYRAWLKELMTTPNPYTGIPLSEESAVAAFTFFNEDTLYFYTFQNLRGAPLREAQTRFGEWATHRYGSIEEALKTWDGATVEGDAPDEGRLGFIGWWQASAERLENLPSRKRLRDQMAFLDEVQRNYYTGMRAWMREELGARQLFMTSNFRPAQPATMFDAESKVKASLDIVGLNSYPGGSIHRGEQGWRITPGDDFLSVSNTNKPLELPQVTRQVANHPFLITECTWTYPNEYANEGALLSAIYGGVSGIQATSFAGPRDIAYSGESFYLPFGETEDGALMKRWNISEPGAMAPFVGAALIARNGYAAQSGPAVIEKRTPEEIFSLELPLLPQGADYDPTRDQGNTGSSEASEDSLLPPEAFLMGPVLMEIGSGEDYIAPQVREYKGGPLITSLDGNVTTNRKTGLTTLDTPKAQAAVGFLDQAGPVTLADTRIESSNEHLGVAIVSLDDRPIAGSRRLLVQLAPRVRPTGWKVERSQFETKRSETTVDGWKIVNTGSTPFRAEKVKGRLVLKNPHITRATALDAGGLPKEELILTKEGSSVALEFPGQAFYVILE